MLNEIASQYGRAPGCRWRMERQALEELPHLFGAGRARAEREGKRTGRG